MHESENWKWTCSVVSNSSLPHGLQPTRLLHPWGFPGKSTGVGCHCKVKSFGMRFSAFCSYNMIPLEQKFLIHSPRARDKTVASLMEWHPYVLSRVLSRSSILWSSQLASLLWNLHMVRNSGEDVGASFFLTCGACGSVSALWISTKWKNGVSHIGQTHWL